VELFGINIPRNTVGEALIKIPQTSKKRKVKQELKIVLNNNNKKLSEKVLKTTLFYETTSIC